MFEAKKLLDCKQDQVITACQSLYEGLIPLTGEYMYEDQELPSIVDAPRGYHTGLSKYTSAVSEFESEESIGI